MAFAVYELSLRVMVFTLTIAIATLSTYADQKLCNTVTTCRLGKEKMIVNTTVTPNPYYESKTAAKYEVEIRNQIAIKPLNDETEIVTSESTSTAARCSFEETGSVPLGGLLDAGEGALVTLVAGETRLIAHRAVLAARSPGFAAMICHGPQDASSGQVAITDVEGPVLRQILAYLYTLQAPQLPGMALQLLAAADKFGLSALKAECEAHVEAQLAVETAADIAVLAIKHSSTSLRQAAIAFIRAHTNQVTATPGWAHAVLNHPYEVIEVYRLLAKPPVETSPQNASLGSTPATAESQPTTESQSLPHSSQGQTPVTAAAESQPTTESQSLPHSSQGQTPVATAPPAPACHIPPPDDDAVSRLRSVSSEEKRRKLLLAAKEGRQEEVEALLAAGATISASEGGTGKTALHLAAEWGHVEVASEMVGCGAEVDASDVWQYRPLHYAASHGHTAVVRLLVAASADPNARAWDGWTPLHFAAHRGQAEAAVMLLEAGADRSARANCGKTPLDLARQKNRQQLIQLLT